jgi:hypothetical protein
MKEIKKGFGGISGEESAYDIIAIAIAIQEEEIAVFDDKCFSQSQ